MPMVRPEADRGGRGRVGLPNRSRMGDRGQSPPMVPPEGEPPMAPLDRDKLDQKGGHGLRDHHGNTAGGVGGGAGSGGRYRHTPDDRKMAPRHKNPRHGGGRVGVAPGGEGERGGDKSQLLPVSQFVCVCIDCMCMCLYAHFCMYNCFALDWLPF